jgi:predicted RNA-binding Zn ribbon-like protein
MAVEWTPHRFSGGVLALDTTNTVVLRGDPARRFDRFDDPAEIARFADAAAFSAAPTTRRAAIVGGRSGGNTREGASPCARRSDALFRGFATAAPCKRRQAAARMLRACATALDGGDER